MFKYLPLFFILISCSNTKVIETVKFKSDLYSPTIVNSNYLFLSNVAENHSIPCVINIDTSGSINWIFSIDSYEENIPDYPYFKLINNQGRGVLIYKYKNNHVKIYDLITRSNIVSKEIENDSYITLIKSEDDSIAIKSGFSYGSNSFRGYTVSLYSMDNNLNLISQGEVELSSYPLDISYLGNNIYYYEEAILYNFNLDDRKLYPSFKFDNDIVKIVVNGGFLYVLTTRNLYRFKDAGIIDKSFILNSKDKEFIANDLIFTKDKIIVKLSNSKDYTLLTINKLKNRIISNNIPNDILRGNFILEDDKIFYIEDSHLHIRRF